MISASGMIILRTGNGYLHPHFDAQPTIRLLAMLLPSPIKHIFSPLKLPLRSRMVIKSASTWQGCAWSVKPLIIGMTEPYVARVLYLLLGDRYGS